ncbi:MAG: Asp-tRNA(Asn)/Glu-tRNA(Gln) amidotransferase subunit GatC [Planctomycetota bacterium]|jgi:aspartyl-tRNA(Asn)/glutamyl-tRNA(Gln) amidotransferase subunit C|nr:Asp-tRNA(Asn)/Glu-tRNA(Gln) amidotransferase subunit GatC [Planctomycetota bacterium]
MALNEQTVRHVAHLARLDLSDDEVHAMTRELDAIVGYVEQLQEVDTTGVEAVANVAGLVNITRSDEPIEMLSHEQVLRNAPKANGEAFLVPKAVER